MLYKYKEYIWFMGKMKRFIMVAGTCFCFFIQQVLILEIDLFFSYILEVAMIVSITMMMISRTVPAISRIPDHLLGFGFGIVALVLG
jgi:hypothetical protein